MVESLDQGLRQGKRGINSTARACPVHPGEFRGGLPGVRDRSVCTTTVAGEGEVSVARGDAGTFASLLEQPDGLAIPGSQLIEPALPPPHVAETGERSSTSVASTALTSSSFCWSRSCSPMSR